jgi:hypothetical protein
LIVRALCNLTAILFSERERLCEKLMANFHGGSFHVVRMMSPVLGNIELLKVALSSGLTTVESCECHVEITNTADIVHNSINISTVKVCREDLAEFL